jgi:integrase
MATFRKRANRWQVQVRRRGFAPRSKTFDQRRDAERWATLQERDYDLLESRGEVASAALDVTVGGLLARYRTTMVSKKRCAYSETYIVAAMERRDIASFSVRSLKPDHVVAYRDQRLSEVGPAGVARELRLLQHALETARTSWGFAGLENAVKDVKKPTEPRGRERRLSASEEAALLEALDGCQNPFVLPVVQFALATSMRQGEILSLQWSWCNLKAQLATLPLTKNGRVRTVPLSKAATSVLEALPRSGPVVFDLSREALKQAWARAVRRAKISDLHFHDLRHEAISRLFELGLEMPEVMMISGHTDPRMLVRYTHLNARKLVAKLDAQ